MSRIRQIVCPACAAVNRVPAHRPMAAARCGKCREPLFAGRPADADAGMFERQTRRSDVPVLVDIWAPWCGPCRAMMPAFEAAAAELEPEIRLIRLNSQAEQETATRLAVTGIPTLLLFEDGREIGRVSGAMSTPQIVAWARALYEARKDQDRARVR